MPAAHTFLQSLALVLCVAAVTTVVFHHLRQPVVFGYLLAGMIVGPHLAIPIVADEQTVQSLSELGVILLMFSLGLEFTLRRVAQVASTSGLAALAETSVMLGLGYLAGQRLGLTAIESLFVGAMLAISSTTIIAKAFAEQGVTGRVTDVVFGILIVEDLIAIVLVAVLTAIASGGALSAAALAMTAFRLVIFLTGLIVVGLLLVPRLVRGVVRTGRTEVTLVASVGICFAAAMLALNFGYSVALGGFIAGSLVAESGEAKVVEHLVLPVRDLFVAIFFVAVGMLIDPRVVAEHWGTVLVLTLVVVTGKVVAVTAGAFLTGNGLRPSVQAGMSLAQIGEFSFIIAAVGTAAGVLRPFLYPVAIAVSAITTMTTPWLIRGAAPAAVYLDRKLPRPIQTYVALYGSWIERLRTASPTAGGRQRIRRLVRLIALDAFLLLVVAAGTSVEMERLAATLEGWLGLTQRVAGIVVAAGGMIIAVPLLVGIVLSARRLGFALAARALPAARHGRVDFAQAPRALLVTTLQLAILLAIGAPMLVLLQPVLQPLLLGVPTLALLLVVPAMLSIAFWRRARNLQGHAQAGAQVIAAALSAQSRSADDARSMSETREQMSAMLPGLGDPTPVRLDVTSQAVGRTLAELNIRGLTGATVLAISHADDAGRTPRVPTGEERLRSGDLLALAGSTESVEAARELLGTSLGGS